MEFIVIAVLIGLLPAFIAKSKGKSFIGWWIYGALLLIVALPHSLIMKADEKTIEAEAIANGGRKCPYCAEIVKAEALVCRFCQRELPPLPAALDTTARRCETCEIKIIPMNKRQCAACITEYGLIAD